MLWQCFSHMLYTSSLFLPPRRTIKRSWPSRNLQGSFLTQTFESYVFPEAHLVSLCISYCDINTKCIGDAINVTGLLWVILLLWSDRVRLWQWRQQQRKVGKLGHSEDQVYSEPSQTIRSLIHIVAMGIKQVSERIGEAKEKKSAFLLATFKSALLGIPLLIWVMRVPKIHVYICRLMRNMALRKKW